MMNPYTKRSLVHFLLSLAAIILGLLVFILVCNKANASASKPYESDDGFYALGRALGAVLGLFTVVITGIIDAVFTSFFVYMFAYFSHENAKISIDACGDESTTAKTLRVISVIEMVIAAIIALIGLLLIMLIFK